MHLRKVLTMVSLRSSHKLIGVESVYHGIIFSVLWYPSPEDQIFNRVISDISVELREITLTIKTDSLVETEIVRVVSLSITEITEITPFKTRYSGPGYLKGTVVICSCVQDNTDLMDPRLYNDLLVVMPRFLINQFVERVTNRLIFLLLPALLLLLLLLLLD